MVFEWITSLFNCSNVRRIIVRHMCTSVLPGDVSYKDLGCFADKGRSNRPLPEMLFSDEAKRKSESWDEFLPDLICSCAKAAKEKNYKFFGIQNFAECWSGSNAKDTYQKDGASQSCINTERLHNATNVTKMAEKYETCPKDNLVCAGKLGANYVYGLDNGRSK